MACHHNGDLSDDSAMTFPATVERGEAITCYVSVDTWDERLYLIANDCRFMSTSDDSGPSFSFFKDKYVLIHHYILKQLSSLLIPTITK